VTISFLNCTSTIDSSPFRVAGQAISRIPDGGSPLPHRWWHCARFRPPPTNRAHAPTDGVRGSVDRRSTWPSVSAEKIGRFASDHFGRRRCELGERGNLVWERREGRCRQTTSRCQAKAELDLMNLKQSQTGEISGLKTIGKGKRENEQWSCFDTF
jgi:hypothetical protein